MSNYVQTTNFGAKDALTTGDPNKKILGSAYDVEFSAIATAIATKYDSSSVATNSQAASLANDAVLITPTKLLYALANGTFTTAKGFITNLLPKGTPVGVQDYLVLYDAAGDALKKATIAQVVANSGAWTSSNDGAGSGMDADTVDGQHASAFATAGHTHATSDLTEATWTTFVMNVSGVSAVATQNWRYQKIGKLVVIESTSGSGSVTTASAQTIVLSALPAAIRPSSAKMVSIPAGWLVSGAVDADAVYIQSDGSMTLSQGGVTNPYTVGQSIALSQGVQIVYAID